MGIPGDPSAKIAVADRFAFVVPFGSPATGLVPPVTGGEPPDVDAGDVVGWKVGMDVVDGRETGGVGRAGWAARAAREA